MSVYVCVCMCVCVDQFWNSCKSKESIELNRIYKSGRGRRYVYMCVSEYVYVKKKSRKFDE